MRHPQSCITFTSRIRRQALSLRAHEFSHFFSFLSPPIQGALWQLAGRFGNGMGTDTSPLPFSFFPLPLPPPLLFRIERSPTASDPQRLFLSGIGTMHGTTVSSLSFLFSRWHGVRKSRGLFSKPGSTWGAETQDGAPLPPFSFLSSLFHSRK